MNSNYWNSQYNYYMSNQPPKAESYYNKDFAEKIREAQANIDGLVAEKDKAWSATAQKQDEYNAFYGSMSTYKDVYTQSKSEFGIEEHQENYEKSKKALAMAESTLSALPSTINSASNRVLTQEQRERRYNILADKQMSYRNNLLAKSSAYEDVWKKARENQATYTSAEMNTQYGKLGELQNSFVTAMDNYNKMADKVLKAKIDKIQWESQYRAWQHQQYEMAQDVWFKNMSTALDRYIDTLNTELAVRQSEIAKRRANTGALMADAQNSMADTLVAYHRYQQAGK